MAARTLQHYKRRTAALDADLQSWRAHWMDLAKNFLPRHSDWLFNLTPQQSKKGAKKNQHIVDSTVREAVVTFQAGMMSGLTSPSRPWFRLSTPDPDMMEVPSIKQWLYVVEVRMRDWLSKSNLYSVLPSAYGSLGVFGVSAIGQFDAVRTNDPHAPPAFFHYPIGSYHVAQSPDLYVDTFYLKRQMRVEQMVAKFGLSNVSPNVRDQYEAGHLDQTHEVTYAVEPNKDYTGQYIDNRNLAYTAVWFESSKSAIENGQFLSVSGFHEFPVHVPRWETDPDTAYGATSPGMDALGDGKGLQIQQRRKAKAIDKHVDPPLQAPEKLRGKTISMVPGDITYYDQVAGAAGVRSLYDFKPELGPVLEDIGEIQDRIRCSFFTDLFRMISNTAQDPQRTAYEVAQLKEEKLLMLGPALENMNKGELKPLIDRTFGQMSRAGLLPPPPPELHGVDLRIEYISILAQAQRMVGIGSIDRLAQYVTQSAQVNPEIADKFDWDQSVDEYADALGTPPSLVVPDDVVAQRRAARAQQQQQQRLMENAPGAADAAKKLSETNPNGDNALSRLIQATTGAAAG